MNKYLKYLMLLIGVAAVSGGVSWVVARASMSDSPTLPVHTQGSTRIPATANDYGFLQSNYELTSSRSVGSAPDLIPAAESAVQAVVHIKVEGEQTMDYIDPFEFFFGGGRGFDRPQSRPVTSFGSGVIISTDGYVITNNHVVEGGNKISITLNDSRSFEAKLIGSDPTDDIALLKVDAKDLPTIPFGNSDELKLGEWVLAVGNPFNLTGTVTAGIISAKARSTAVETGTGDARVARFIQTDAAVNRGNSGGALVDAQGRLIGINTMIFSETGNYSGYSFAVPINTAAKIVADIKKYGSVQRAMLGIMGGSVTEELRKEEKLQVSQGVYVSDFAEVSAAYAAGVEKGDVIIALDGEHIADMAQLQELVGRHRPGDKVTLTIDRKGKQKEFRVELKNSEGNTKIIRANQKEILGATLQEISGEQMRAQGISNGVEVTQIHSGKLQQAGVQKGFIILSINNKRVRRVEDVHNIVNAVKNVRRGNKVLIIKGFYPGGTIKFITVELD